MSTPSENGNPALAKALAEADESSNRRDYINNLITIIIKAMSEDTYEMRNPSYSRKNFTIGAMLAYDSVVRLLASRAGVNLRLFDEAIALATQAVLSESNQRNPIGEKLAKAIIEAYANESYQ